MLLDDAGDLPQIVRPESVIDRQPRRRQPEFGIKAGFCNGICGGSLPSSA